MLVENKKLADAIRKQIAVELADDKWTKEVADKWLADIDKLNREMKEELGDAIKVNEVKNDLWLANRNLETSRAAVRDALKTWRITKEQFKEGTGANIQQVAQASEQYYFFFKQATDAYQILLRAENSAD